MRIELNTKNEIKRPANRQLLVTFLVLNGLRQTPILIITVQLFCSVLLLLHLRLGLNQYLFLTKFELKTKNETEDPLFTLRLVSCLIFNSMFDVGKSASASHRTPCTQFFASGGRLTPTSRIKFNTKTETERPVKLGPFGLVFRAFA